MEEYYSNFRVVFDELLEVTWIRHSKIDATKQLTRRRPSKEGCERILIVSELKDKNQYLTSPYLKGVDLRTPV